MEFTTPNGDLRFSIPDEWWFFAEMQNFKLRDEVPFFMPRLKESETFEKIAIRDIEPPIRTVPGLWFRKYKLMPILFAFLSPECALPLVILSSLEVSSPYKYKVVNGFHRYYASIAVGFSFLPVRVV